MNIEANISHQNLKDLYEEIKQNINNIDKIELDDSKELETSAMISMLVALKKSHNNIEISKLNDNSNIKGLGKIIIKE